MEEPTKTLLTLTFFLRFILREPTIFMGRHWWLTRCTFVGLDSTAVNGG